MEKPKPKKKQRGPLQMTIEGEWEPAHTKTNPWSLRLPGDKPAEKREKREATP